MSNIKLRPDAIIILNQNKGEESLLEYHLLQKENDPGYLQWLFYQSNNIGDFNRNITEQQNDVLKVFEKHLFLYSDIK